MSEFEQRLVNGIVFGFCLALLAAHEVYTIQTFIPVSALIGALLVSFFNLTCLENGPMWDEQDADTQQDADTKQDATAQLENALPLMQQYPNRHVENLAALIVELAELDEADPSKGDAGLVAALNSSRIPYRRYAHNDRAVWA